VAKHEWYSEAFLAQQRSMSASEKIAAVFALNELVRRVTESRERQLHPEADEREIFLRVAAHRLDRDTMLRVYGWYPPDPS